MLPPPTSRVATEIRPLRHVIISRALVSWNRRGSAVHAIDGGPTGDIGRDFGGDHERFVRILGWTDAVLYALAITMLVLLCWWWM
jgi:hypothetical protein